MTFLQEATLLLAAAVVFVPLFKRLGLGSVLGYLAAGVLLGPTGFSLVGEAKELMHFAEFGVVMLLFLIGLELEPKRLWRLRNEVFGAGALQVVGTAAALGALLLFGATWQLTLVLAGSFALSSTAFALQLMNERRELALPHGRTGFAILLFQDLAVIPMLAALPLLAPRAPQGDASLWVAFLVSAGTIAAVILAGKFVLKPVLRIVAATRNHELSVALALLLVLGTAALMHAVGISMALGAFLAGVVLADSEYRHELEANIAPFQGLLLGLFFMTVGMSADFKTLVANPILVVAGALTLVAVKMLILFGIGRLFRLGNDSAFRLAITLSQGGEFAFVLLSVGADQQIVRPEVLNLAIVVITISMAITPILIVGYDAWARRKKLEAAHEPAYEMSGYEDNPVILAGFGRYGQMVGRMLRMMSIPFTALEVNPTHVDFVRKFGNEVFYGDAARLDLLRAAKADKASIMVIAVDDVEASVAIAERVRESFPHLKIFARARNRPHAFALRAMEVNDVRRETFASAIETGQAVLEGLGIDSGSAAQAAQRFREHDEDLLERQYTLRDDEKKLVESAREAAARLEGLFERDEVA